MSADQQNLEDLAKVDDSHQKEAEESKKEEGVASPKISAKSLKLQEPSIPEDPISENIDVSQVDKKPLEEGNDKGMEKA